MATTHRLTCQIIIGLSMIIISQALYNKQWSYNLNRYSRITHCSKYEIQNWSCQLCNQGEKLTNTVYIQNKITNVVGYLGYLPSKNKILLLLRGTVDIKNWIQDFTYKLVQFSACKGCLIHEGFYLDYLSVASKIQQQIKHILAIYPSARLVVIGSSLGAALATVAGIQLQLASGLVDQLHLYGCPRVGNANFAQYLTIKISQIYRVIHFRDIVPHVPLVQQNYHHPPFQILYDQKMQNYKVCDSSGEDPSCSNAFNPNYSIPDHTSYWF